MHRLFVVHSAVLARAVSNCNMALCCDVGCPAKNVNTMPHCYCKAHQTHVPHHLVDPATVNAVQTPATQVGKSTKAQMQLAKRRCRLECMPNSPTCMCVLCAGMALATMFVTLPFIVRELIPTLEQMDLAQEEAAKTLGANPLQVWCIGSGAS